MGRGAVTGQEWDGLPGCARLGEKVEGEEDGSMRCALSLGVWGWQQMVKEGDGVQ